MALLFGDIDTNDLIAICDASAITEGRALRVEMADHGPFAVFLHQGFYYVTDDTCTHGAASLSDGEIFDEEVECPFHKGAFNFRTGEPTARPCTIALKAYVVTMRDSTIYIHMPRLASP